jgi:putative membrane protein
MAGLVATVPMSISMLIGWSLLPRREKYHLPPRMLTEEIAERVGIEDKINETELTSASVLSHFGYGALTGSMYALIEPKIPLGSSVKGGIAGVLVWVLSYLGWVPALRILPPATEHPWRRNLMMILAHLVWGVTLGEVTRKLVQED